MRELKGVLLDDLKNSFILSYFPYIGVLLDWWHPSVPFTSRYKHVFVFRNVVTVESDLGPPLKMDGPD